MKNANSNLYSDVELKSIWKIAIKALPNAVKENVLKTENCGIVYMIA